MKTHAHSKRQGNPTVNNYFSIVLTLLLCAIATASLYGCQVVAAGLFLSTFAVSPALTEELTEKHKAMLVRDLKQGLITKEAAAADCERLLAKTLEPKQDCIFSGA
jgi:hypothetical protein